MSAPGRQLDRYVVRALRRARLRRAIFAAAIAVPCIVTVLLIVPLLTGGTPRPSAVGPAASTRALIGGCLLVIGVAAALPPRSRATLREIDRRLGLGGALLTAVEQRDSDDAVCRLLVRRTTRAVGRRPGGHALPLHLARAALIAPLTGCLTIALAYAPWSAGIATSAGVRSAGEASALLQAAAESIVGQARPSDDVALEAARELARIDAALRRGAVTPIVARELVDALVAELDAAARHDPGAPGAADSATAPAASPRVSEPRSSWRRELSMLGQRLAQLAASSAGPGESGATGTLGVSVPGLRHTPGGAGGGRGTGRAEMTIADASRAGTSAAAAPSGAAWSLPAPRHWSRAPATEIPASDPRGDLAGALRGRPARLDAPPTRPLTPPERRLVDAYFQQLTIRQRQRAVPAGADAGITGGE